MRLRTFTSEEDFLWYYCSPVCGSPTLWVWDLVLSCLCLSYNLVAASSLFLHMEYLFLVGSSVVLSMVVQQLLVIFVLSQEEVSVCPCIPPS